MFRLFDEGLRDVVETDNKILENKYQNMKSGRAQIDSDKGNIFDDDGIVDHGLHLLRGRNVGSNNVSASCSNSDDDNSGPSHDSGRNQRRLNKSKYSRNKKDRRIINGRSKKRYKSDEMTFRDDHDEEYDDLEIIIGNDGLRKKITGPALHLLKPLPSLKANSMTTLSKNFSTEAKDMSPLDAKNKYKVLPSIGSSPEREEITNTANNKDDGDIELQVMNNETSKYSPSHGDFSLLVSEESTHEERNRTRRMMEHRGLILLEVQRLNKEREQKRRLKDGKITEEYSKNFNASAGRCIAEYKDMITKKIHDVLKSLEVMDPSKTYKKKDEQDDSLKSRVQRVMAKLKEKEKPKGRGALLLVRNKLSMADRLAEAFEKAIEFNPLDYTHFENAATSNYLIGNYEK